MSLEHRTLPENCGKGLMSRNVNVKFEDTKPHIITEESHGMVLERNMPPSRGSFFRNVESNVIADAHIENALRIYGLVDITRIGLTKKSEGDFKDNELIKTRLTLEKLSKEAEKPIYNIKFTISGEYGGNITFSDTAIDGLHQVISSKYDPQKIDKFSQNNYSHYIYANIIASDIRYHDFTMPIQVKPVLSWILGNQLLAHHARIDKPYIIEYEGPRAFDSDTILSDCKMQVIQKEIDDSRIISVDINLNAVTIKRKQRAKVKTELYCRPIYSTI